MNMKLNQMEYNFDINLSLSQHDVYCDLMYGRDEE